jgi:uncharacterized protein YicC (UPF0701 family)
MGESLAQILKFPDVFKSERKETDEAEWIQIKQCVNDAINQLNNFRDVEGLSLQKDFEERLGKINTCLEEIKKLDTVRINGIKDRIRNNIEEVIGKSYLLRGEIRHQRRKGTFKNTLRLFYRNLQRAVSRSKVKFH